MNLRIYLIFAFAVVFNAAANVLLKLGMRGHGGVTEAGPAAIVRSVLLNPPVLAGLASFGLAFAAYSVLLSKVNLSVAYPLMTSLGLALVVLASLFIFRESISVLQFAGLALIVGGVWLVSAG